ncbi:hypothetical protein BH09PLA1_BH09PLA1_03570 [soil metagenome]
MSASRDLKADRKKAVADAIARGEDFAVTSFGRQRAHTKVAVVGAVLLAICGPLIYLYRRVRNKQP